MATAPLGRKVKHFQKFVVRYEDDVVFPPPKKSQEVDQFITENSVEKIMLSRLVAANQPERALEIVSSVSTVPVTELTLDHHGNAVNIVLQILKVKKPNSDKNKTKVSGYKLVGEKRQAVQSVYHRLAYAL